MDDGLLVVTYLRSVQLDLASFFFSSLPLARSIARFRLYLSTLCIYPSPKFDGRVRDIYIYIIQF